MKTVVLIPEHLVRMTPYLPNSKSRFREQGQHYDREEDFRII